MTLEGVPVVYPVNDYGPVMKGLVRWSPPSPAWP
jgi:hypothetical protein